VYGIINKIINKIINRIINKIILFMNNIMIHSKDKRRIKSHYRMRGMGDLITMYGGAAEDIENDYQSKKADFMKAKSEYDLSKDSKSREMQRQRMETLRKSMDSAKEKAKAIYRGLSDATSKAASSLSSGVKSLWKKMSSGIKTAGNKLSSGAKSLDKKARVYGSKVNNKLNQIQDSQNRKQYEKLRMKYGSQTSNENTNDTSETSETSSILS